MANIEKLRENLERNGFKTSLFATGAEAADYLCEAITGTTVGFGGSMTLQALGLYERLGEKNDVAWHWKSEDKAAAIKKAAAAKVYLSSANAVAESGEIVNIDGSGNRVAALLHGHEKVYIVIGRNKIEENVEKAIYRARNIAAPLNTRRFKFSTPCAVSETMRCYDCSHPQRICKGMTIMAQKTAGVGECEILIINEDFGF